MTTLAFALASVLACHTAFGQHPASPAELKKLVKDYAFRSWPELNSDTQFVIEEYSIDGLKALDVQIILARYGAPDGLHGSQELLIYHGGKLTSAGDWGLMSAVVSGGKLYYTYTYGSGRKFCNLAQLSIVGGKLTFAKCGLFVNQDCFVKQDGGRLRLE